MKPAVIGTQRCVDKGLVFIPRLLLAILANPEGCKNLEAKQNAMKLGISLRRFSAWAPAGTNEELDAFTD